MKRETDAYNIHENDILIKSREIFLFTDDGSEGLDSKVASTFLKNLKILESISKDTIIVHQYNIGGDWSAGMIIYDAILSSPCKFIFITYGAACSMGSIIPQAVIGKGIRVTHPNCDWMIHEGSSSGEGTHKQFLSMTEFHKNVLDKIYNIYTDVCSQSIYFKKERSMKRSQIKGYIKRKLDSKEDWYLNAEEAVYYGFSDCVFGTEHYTSIEQIKRHVC